MNDKDREDCAGCDHERWLHDEDDHCMEGGVEGWYEPCECMKFQGAES